MIVQRHVGATGELDPSWILAIHFASTAYLLTTFQRTVKSIRQSCPLYTVYQNPNASFSCSSAKKKVLEIISKRQSKKTPRLGIILFGKIRENSQTDSVFLKKKKVKNINI